MGCSDPQNTENDAFCAVDVRVSAYMSARSSFDDVFAQKLKKRADFCALQHSKGKIYVGV